MSNPVFLVPPGSIHNGLLALDGDEGRHAATVKRLRVGEPIDVCDGEGVRGTGSVSAVSKNSVDIHVHEISREPRPTIHFTVVQAVAKGDRAEMAVEILTELGVTTIIPWTATRSIAKLDAEKGQAKWQRVAREAAKQSRRAWLPMVESPATTTVVAERIATGALSLVLHEGATQPLVDVELPESGEVLVVVGPEGGIADQELEAFAQAGARVVRLGSHVLRTSTAGAAALAVLASRTDSWRNHS